MWKKKKNSQPGSHPQGHNLLLTYSWMSQHYAQYLMMQVFTLSLHLQQCVLSSGLLITIQFWQWVTHILCIYCVKHDGRSRVHLRNQMNENKNEASFVLKLTVTPRAISHHGTWYFYHDINKQNISNKWNAWRPREAFGLLLLFFDCSWSSVLLLCVT